MPRIHALVRPCGLFLVAALALGACLRVGYVVQAGFGQLELVSKARSIDKVLADSRTDRRTHFLLSEVAPVLSFANERGLTDKGNYRKYVDIDRPAAVWFMATSKELAFEPKVWSFPIVGSFTYLGWFNELEAHRIERLLAREGWDVHVRTARAYSTGGWFNDPVLSSMLSPRDDALRGLVNVLMHELTHANILLRDQSTFNENIASFVGDTMAEQYLVARFGDSSAEVALYREESQLSRERGAGLAAAYHELETLYASARSDAEKRAEKARLLGQLDRDFGLWYQPNNASLLGFKTYNAGLEELAALFTTCEREWPRFFAVVQTLTPGDFAGQQDENIGPVIDRLAKGGCPAVAGAGHSSGSRASSARAAVTERDIAAIRRAHLATGTRPYAATP